ncbi:MAG: FAD-dependent oxidoreductase [Candidatus Methanomethylophilaceae archaeon]|nr:FAD-dependent oxidoreductase [Candidatus Methanomethylophilaceae archaeon]
MANEIIVIGSGAAGMSAASAAKSKCPEAKVTVFTEDEDVAYSPCAIPWGIEGKIPWEGLVMHTPEFYAKERGIDIHTRTTVESVDDESKTVTAGGAQYHYDSLVIATGGKVFVPPISGANLKNVFVVRTVRDGKNIQAALKDATRVVIGGAGVIGLELAVAFKEMGKEVTVVEMMDQVIPRIADRDMADVIQKDLEGRGIRFVMKAPLQSVNGQDKVESVSAAGETIPCDVVIFATGVRANLEIPKALGLDIGHLNAVIASPTMNPYRRGRLVPDIFVAGDLVQCSSAVMPGATMSQLGSTAVKQGMIAGTNAVCKDKVLFGEVASPWVSCIGDNQIAGTGLSKGLASWYGIDVAEGKAEGTTRARYYPGGLPYRVKLLADRTSHRIVGGQIVAGEGATGRIEWITMAVVCGMTAEDFLVKAETAYCPPTSMVRDPVLWAAEDLIKNLKQ